MTTTQKYIVAILVLLAIGIAAYALVNRAPAPVVGGSTATSTGSTSTTTANGSGTASSTPQLILVTPDYKKPILFSSSVDAQTRAQLNEALKTAQAGIDKNKLNIQAWVDLGSVHKMGGDYAAAALYWEYITSIYNGTGAPFYSLGDLYENYLHNYAKAEADYKEAIALNIHNVDAYASLYTMYHYTLHDDAKAAAILKDGLAANPGNNYLLGLQDELK